MTYTVICCIYSSIVQTVWKELLPIDDDDDGTESLPSHSLADADSQMPLDIDTIKKERAGMSQYVNGTNVFDGISV